MSLSLLLQKPNSLSLSIPSLKTYLMRHFPQFVIFLSSPVNLGFQKFHLAGNKVKN
jgi:hypothetical protein